MIKADLAKLPEPIQILCTHLPVALSGGFIVPILLKGTVVEAIAIAIGILLGFVIAAKLFGRCSMEVWITPILCAWLLASGVATLEGGYPLSSKSIVVLGYKSLLAVVLGQFSALLFYIVIERVTRNCKGVKKQ